jgi:hypothetical protein
LPQPGETGAWLVKAGDASPLGAAVAAFVGDRSMPELMEQYGIKSKQTKPGGFRPSVFMLSRYVAMHKELAGKPFEQWTEAQQADYMTWQQQEVSQGGEADANRVAAEGRWASIRETLADHGLKRKSFTFLSRKQLEETRDVMALVSKELGKALKEA